MPPLHTGAPIGRPLPSPAQWDWPASPAGSANRPWNPDRLDGPRVHKVVIVRSTDRDQLRGQITGRKTVRTGGYPSRKTRRARFGEAGAELARIPQEEVEVEIVDAIAQPCRGEVLLEDGWHVHIPDFANLRSDGTRVLIDAKRDWAGFRTEDGRRQTFLGQVIADAMGYGYERYVLAHAGSARRRENVDEVQASASFTFPTTSWPEPPPRSRRGPLPSATSPPSCTRSTAARWPTRSWSAASSRSTSTPGSATAASAAPCPRSRSPCRASGGEGLPCRPQSQHGRALPRPCPRLPWPPGARDDPVVRCTHHDRRGTAAPGETS